MSPEQVLSIGRSALETTLLMSAPALIAALVVGVLVGIFQAATQINEMTLSFVPKLLALFFTLVLAGPWLLHVLTDFTRRLILSIPGLLE
jgi:flagellar biosynthetic protein FliQ